MAAQYLAFRGRRPTRTGRIGAIAVAATALAVTLFASVHAATRRSPAHTLYVALGDSYAAGPGIPTQLDDRSGCQRSDHSYPALVAEHLELAPSQYRDASCSGAVVADLAAPQDTGSATVPPQLNALSADATLVTVGIGGNDLDFRGILTRCVALDAVGVLVAEARHATDRRAPCRESYTRDGADQIGQKVQAASVALATALRRVHDLAPHARVLVVGYPDLLPPTGGEACARALGITAADVAYLGGEEVQLNRELHRRASAAGDRYVDTYTPSTGHDACADPATRWIEPLVPAAPAIPMHPNATGQRAIAGAVERAIA